MNSLDPTLYQHIIESAMAEDRPFGDITSETFIGSQRRSVALLAAREPGTLSGIEVFAQAMRYGAPNVEVVPLKNDGERFAAGEALARVLGPTQAILGNERVALNLVQRMSAVATHTSELVALIADLPARLVDTRKTTPGLRVLEKYAVRCGGGHNHRYSLSDAVMLKDNHLEAIFEQYRDASGEVDLDAAAGKVRELRGELAHTVHLEIEVDSPELIPFALSAGAQTIMLDNFTLEQLREGVQQIAGRASVEASGGLSAERLREIALAGVDIISIGALTHSAPAIDLGLDFVSEQEPESRLSGSGKNRRTESGREKTGAPGRRRVSPLAGGA